MLIIPSSLFNWFFLANSNVLWNLGVDKKFLIIWFWSSLFIQTRSFSRQYIILIVFLFNIVLFWACVNYWFKAILDFPSQILIHLPRICFLWNKIQYVKLNNYIYQVISQRHIWQIHLFQMKSWSFLDSIKLIIQTKI